MRVMSQKVRQAVLVTGDPVDPKELPEKLLHHWSNPATLERR